MIFPSGTWGPPKCLKIPLELVRPKSKDAAAGQGLLYTPLWVMWDIPEKHHPSAKAGDLEYLDRPPENLVIFQKW